MKQFALALAISMTAATVHAQADSLPDWLKIDGFGTVGMFHADDPIATVRSDTKTSTGSHQDTRYDADSLLALQFKVRPGGPFSAGFQFLSKKDVTSSSRPHVQWAYLGWQPTSEFNFKLGRSVAPVFLMSDYNDLYYAQIAARPPTQVYANNAITFNDGLTGLWERNVGDAVLGLEGYYGKTKVAVAAGPIDVPRQAGLAAKWNTGPLTLRVAYTRAIGNFRPFAGDSIDQFLGLVRNAQQLGLCSNCNQVYLDRFKLQDTVNKMYSLGVIWDNDQYVLQSEWVRRTSDSAVLSGSGGWYVLGAKRLGAFTPYVVLGRIKPISPPVGLILTPPAQPTTTQLALLGVLAGANAANVTGQYQRSQRGVGLRWDFHPSMALKAQWDQYKVDDTHWGSVPEVQYPMGPASKFDGRVNAYTLNLDFTF